MGLLRIYRKFFYVSTATLPHTYTLFTPTNLSAATYVAGAGGEESSSLIESAITLVEEELGIFYANLNPNLYSSDVTYDLVFYVQYTPEAPSNKRLPVRFRIKTINLVSQLDYDINNSSLFEVEVYDSNSIGIKILDNSINIDKSYEEVEHYINNNGGSIDIELD